MEKLVTLVELKELRDKLINKNLNNDDVNKINEMFPDNKNVQTFQNETNNIDKVFPNENSKTSSKEIGYQLTKTSSKYPSLLDKRAGFSNVIYLATMSLVFEVLFLAVSFLIFN